MKISVRWHFALILQTEITEFYGSNNLDSKSYHVQIILIKKSMHALYTKILGRLLKTYMH